MKLYVVLTHLTIYSTQKNKRASVGGGCINTHILPLSCNNSTKQERGNICKLGGPGTMPPFSPPPRDFEIRVPAGNECPQPQPLPLRGSRTQHTWSNRAFCQILNSTLCAVSRETRDAKKYCKRKHKITELLYYRERGPPAMFWQPFNFLCLLSVANIIYAITWVSHSAIWEKGTCYLFWFCTNLYCIWYDQSCLLLCYACYINKLDGNLECKPDQTRSSHRSGQVRSHTVQSSPQLHQYWRFELRQW